jgi:hypothetical protein
MMTGAARAAVFAAAHALPQATDNSKLLNALFDQFMRENPDVSPLLVTNLGMNIVARNDREH